MSTAQQPQLPPETSLIEAVWRYRLMSSLIIMLTVAATIAATELLFGSATATGRFAVTDPTNKDYSQMGVVSGPSYATYTAQRAAFARSEQVLKRASDLVTAEGGPRYTLSELRGAVQAATKPDSGVVEITAKSGSMRSSARIVNAIIQAYRDVTATAIRARSTSQLTAIQAAEKKIIDQMVAEPVKTSRRYRELGDTLHSLQGSEGELLTNANRRDDGVQFVDNADPTAKTPSKIPRNAVIGLALGVLLACVVSFLRATSPVDRRFRSAKPPAVRLERHGREPVATAVSPPPPPKEEEPAVDPYGHLSDDPYGHLTDDDHSVMQAAMRSPRDEERDS